MARVGDDVARFGGGWTGGCRGGGVGVGGGAGGGRRGVEDRGGQGRGHWLVVVWEGWGCWKGDEGGDC